MHRNRRESGSAGLVGCRGVEPIHPAPRQIPFHFQVREDEGLRVLATGKVKSHGAADFAMSTITTYQPAAIDRPRLTIWPLDLGANAIGLRFEAGERVAIRHASAAPVQTSFQKPLGVELRKRETAERKVCRNLHRRSRNTVVERRHALQPDTAINRVLGNTEIVEDFQGARCNAKRLAKKRTRFLAVNQHHVNAVS